MELAQLFHCKFFICSVDMLLSFSICMYILTISLFLFFFPDPFHCRPRTSMYGGGSFKSGFNLTDTTDFQVVQIPFTDFSYDWSGFTGRCDTKDPNGKQHHCCATSGADTKYCPTSQFLSTLTDVEVWAEGAEGDFHLEIAYIGADDKTMTK